MSRNLPFWPRNVRRARIYGARLGRSALRSRPKYRSIFFHQPKCGGTSISEAMYATVPIKDRVGVIDADSTRKAAALWHAGVNDVMPCHDDFENAAKVFELREKLLLQHLAWDTWLVHGHILYSELADQVFGDLYRFVTIMRHPVERTLSNYRMSVRQGTVPSDFDAYLDSYVAHAHAMTSLRYLSGRAVVAQTDAPVALTVAKERLKKFTVVGFLDDLRKFQTDYRDVFGVGLNIGAYNVGVGSILDLSAAQRRKLEDLCGPDIDLYDAARRDFN